MYLMLLLFVLQCQGMWTGMLGGTIVQTSILIAVTMRCDWEKEVTKLENIWRVLSFQLLDDNINIFSCVGYILLSF